MSRGDAETVQYLVTVRDKDRGRLPYGALAISETVSCCRCRESHLASRTALAKSRATAARLGLPLEIVCQKCMTASPVMMFHQPDDPAVDAIIRRADAEKN